MSVFGVFQIVSVALFLFLSAVLIYHRLFGRWLRFAPGFFVVYVLGAYLFFGEIALPFVSEGMIRSAPYFLFFGGSVLCISYGLIRQLGKWQTAGLLGVYWVLLAGFVFLFGSAMGVDLGIPRQGSIESFLTTVPFLLLCASVPMVLGYGMYRGFSFREMAGVGLLLGSVFLLMSIGVAAYFQRPWGFAFAPSAFAQAWIEVGIFIVLVLGSLALLAYAVMNSFTFREFLGAELLFWTLMVGVLAVVYLTVGFPFLGQALAGG